MCGIAIASAIATGCNSAPPGPPRADASLPAPTPASTVLAARPLGADDVAPLLTAADLGSALAQRPEEDRLRSRTLRLGLGRVWCSFSGASTGQVLDVARCQPFGAAFWQLVDADDDAPTTVMSAEGVYDVATGERILPFDQAAPHPIVAAYRRRDGGVLALLIPRHGARAATLLRGEASAPVPRVEIARSGREIEDGRVLGDWLLMSERLSNRDHRLIAQSITNEGRALGPKTAFGVSRSAFRSDVEVEGQACRSSEGLFIVLSAESTELGPGREYTLAMLIGAKWTSVAIDELGALGCHGAQATLIKQSEQSVTETWCAADGCRKVAGNLPYEARGKKGPSDVGTLGDGVLAVWSDGRVFMALSPLTELAAAPAIPFYQPGDGEDVKAVDIFVRRESAVVLLRTSRGVLAIRIDGSGAFSPIRRLP